MLQSRITPFSTIWNGKGITCVTAVHNHRCNQLHFLLSSFWFCSDLGFRGPNNYACMSAHFFLRNYACTLHLSCLIIKLLLRECITGFNSNRVNALYFRLCCHYGMKVIILVGFCKTTKNGCGGQLNTLYLCDLF